MQYDIHYGKADVKVYRTHGTPLAGVTPIPESPFNGRRSIGGGHLHHGCHLATDVRGSRRELPAVEHGADELGGRRIPVVFGAVALDRGALEGDRVHLSTLRGRV